MDIWKHGRYVDLWSLVHVLSGALLGSGLFGLGYGLMTVIVLSLFLLAAWEVFEWAVRIIEPSPNVLVDMLAGALGMGAACYWHYALANGFSVPQFTVLLFATLALALWGFLDFHFHGYR